MSISVIIPIYNVERYLFQCLDSVRAQDVDDMGVLCINDGSTDDSRSVAECYVSEDPRFRLIDKPNGGYGSAVNRGLDEARGEWVAILEPDDWIEPGMYREMMAYSEGFFGPIDIVKTPYWRIWMPDTNEERRMNCSFRGRIRPHNQPFTIHDPGVNHLLRHHPSIWSAIYRRGFLLEHGIRMKEVPGAGWVDNPFLIDTLCQARTILYLDRPYYNYREDTPKKAASFARKQTLVPFERWNDMMDEIDRLGIDDGNILRAQYSRGFTYLSGVLEEVSLDRPDLHDAAVGMFARMKPSMVLRDERISPELKELFIRLRGIPREDVPRLPYLGWLVREGVYTLRNTGPRNAAYMLGQTRARHGTRPEDPEGQEGPQR